MAVDGGQQPASTAAKANDRIPLHSGFELDSESVSVVTRNAWARVIVLAGPEASGKTTLLTSLYESFQRGPFAKYSFAGSLTLPAFERLCHHSRIASQRERADTERTPRGETRRYLHLRVSQQEEHDHRDLLISDLSGEQFRLAMDSETECKKLLLLHRADHVALFIDGEKVVAEETRVAVVQEARRLIRSLLDSDMIGPQTMVELLFSKWDLVSSGDSSKRLNYVQQTEQELVESFGSRLGALRALQVAARPQGEALPFAFGLDTLFSSWVEESLLFERKIDLRIPVTATQFDGFAIHQPR